MESRETLCEGMALYVSDCKPLSTYQQAVVGLQQAVKSHVSEGNDMKGGGFAPPPPPPLLLSSAPPSPLSFSSSLSTSLPPSLPPFLSCYVGPLYLLASPYFNTLL